MTDHSPHANDLCATSWQHPAPDASAPLVPSPVATVQIGAAPDAQPVAPTKEALADLIAGMLSGTYHCKRVWSAWGVGTMSEDDFSPVDESDTPAEIADAVLALYAGAAHPQQPAAEPVVAHPLPTTPVVAHGWANVSHEQTDAIARAWADLPAQLQCHPGIKALHRAALEQPAATVRQALSDEQIRLIAGQQNRLPWGIGSRWIDAFDFARAIERAHGIGAKDGAA